MSQNQLAAPPSAHKKSRSPGSHPTPAKIKRSRKGSGSTIGRVSHSGKPRCSERPRDQDYFTYVRGTDVPVELQTVDQLLCVVAKVGKVDACDHPERLRAAIDAGKAAEELLYLAGKEADHPRDWVASRCGIGKRCLDKYRQIAAHHAVIKKAGCTTMQQALVAIVAHRGTARPVDPAVPAIIHAETFSVSCLPPVAASAWSKNTFTAEAVRGA